MRTTSLLAAVASLGLAASARAEPARWQKVTSQVHVDTISNEFQVEQRWKVTGANRAQLLEATHHLNLSGRYGVYGDRQGLSTAVPESQQNHGGRLSAWAHPVFVPSALGSRAQAVPTHAGFHASMSGGAFGRGESPVEIGETHNGVTEIVERGHYTLAAAKTGFAPFDLAYKLGAATMARPALAVAHKGMGELHNHMFNAAEPLVNWVNDHPNKR